MPKTYDIYGPQNAPTLVFLHAASYNRQMWLPQILELQSDYRILTLDLPGHGALAGTKFSFAASVETVVDVIEQESLEGVLVIGTSLGGCVAMDFSSQYTDRVKGLVLSGCTFDPCTWICKAVLTGESLVFPRGADRFTGVFHREMQTRFGPDIAGPIITGGTYWNAAADAVKAMRGVDFRAKLAAYAGPSLIINGKRDWVHRTAERSFAKAAQNAQVLPIEGASHIANLDQPDAFTEAVRRFAQRVYSEKTNASCLS